ncbi:putative peptidase family-domain-containing protein [Parasitella parasitica]|nr:putative peptidase family-domain-containing protein [Parasitella parasitica]
MNYQAPPIPSRPSSKSIQIDNVKDGETVHQRFLLVNGRAGPRNGSFDRPIHVLCNDFPQTEWPCVNSFFKAMVHLVPGANTITFAFPQENDTLHFHVNYLPLLQNPPLSLVIFIGSDSDATFDVPPEKKGQNTLDIAVQKLRTAGYMWQAFCAEQLHRNGMGRRTFRLEEGWLPDTISCRDRGVMRNTAKVHVIRSKYSVAEIRDVRRAQQSKDQDESVESLFGLFLDDLRESPLFDMPCQVAGLILDSHWDIKNQLTLGHAALGGGAGNTKLGIFGSHLLHAWPTCIEDIVPAFMNNTLTDTRYVANDANESGNWWRAANIGMGAMMHEVGHSYTLSHTPTGVMSRGYNNWNRTFVAKEPGFAPIPPEQEAGSHWHRLDIMRLRFHPAFRIPQDGPLGTKNPSKPSFIALEGGQFQVIAPAGISLLEMNVAGQYRSHFEFLQEQPRMVTFDIKDIWDRCKCNANEKVSLHVVCTNQETKDVDNLNEFLNSHGGVHLPGINGLVLKSDIFGNGSDQGMANYTAVWYHNNCRKQLKCILVNHGAFLDGFTLIYDDGSQDQIGKTGGNCTQFDVARGEHIQGLVVKSGAWIDGVQFRLSSGRQSPWFGGNGGGLNQVNAPQGYDIVGIFGSAKNWMEQIGIFYRRS